jgi:gliding motility-associated-like protein
MKNVHSKTFGFALAQVLLLFVLNFGFSPKAFGQNTAPSADFDGDGIINSIDLDDDNDGILDLTECDSRPLRILFAGSSEDFSTMRSSLYAEFNNNKAAGSTIVQSNIIETATVPAGFYDGYDIVVFGGAAFNTIHANHWAALKTAIQNKTSKAFIIEADNCCVTANQNGLMNLLNGVFGTNYALSANHPGGTESYTLNTNSSYASVFSTNTISGANYFPIANVATSDVLFYSASHPTLALAGMKQIPGTDSKSQFVAWFVDGTITQGAPWYTDNQNKIANGFYDAYFATAPLICDTDNDGIYNHQDLDSDGDSCPDAKEAGSASSTTSVSGVVASPYGANGFADGLETSPGSGLFIGNYSYNYAISNSINACVDADSDGIGDLIDIDDDNDGITDITEQLCTTVNALTDLYGPDYWRSIAWTGGAYLAQYSTATPDIYIDGNLTNGVEVFRPGTTANPIAGDDFTATPIVFTMIPQNPLHADGFSIVNDFGAAGDNILKADIKLYTGSLVNPTLMGTETIDNMLDVSSTTRYPFSKAYDNITSIKIYVYKTQPAGTQAANGMQMGELGLYSTAGTFCASIDTDGDGIYNEFDLDSDGDGCSDALEAGTTNSTSANYTFTGPYGINGLANSLETVADNGIFNGSYTYVYASTSAISTCTDSDSDGVKDIVDIDDDNDGILDAVESPACFYTSSEWLAGSRSSITATTSLAMNATYKKLDLLVDGDNGTAVANYAVLFNASTTAAQTVYAFKMPTPVELKRIYLGYINTNTHFNANTLLRLEGSSDNLSWTALSANTYGSVTSVPGVSGTVNANTFTVTQNSGKYQYYRIYWVSGGGINATGYSNEVYFETLPSYLASANPKTTCLTDTDADGIVNHLDLDSDGDGCPDARETGVTGTLNAGSIVNKVGNVTTTTPNVPNTIAAGGYGANGFADALETVTDNGIYSGTYMYNYANSAAVSLCLDSDNDGVIDINDIDDDNDGVLDVTECPPFDINNLSYSPTAFTVTNGASASQTFPAAPDGLVVNVWTLDNSFNVRINGTHLTNPEELQFWSGAPSDALFEFLDGTTYSAVWGIVGNQAKPLIRIYIDKVGRLKVYGSRTSSGALEEMRLRNGTFNRITLNTNSSNTFQIGQAVVAQTFISGDYGVITPPSCDDDNDGIANGLDLDSDGDGCPDAKEAGVNGTLLSGDVKNGANGAVTSTTNLPNAIAGSAGNYGANGLANVVETSSESGVISYTSTYTNFARSGTLNVCLDSDNDGVADVLDIDDDNDGILDNIEQIGCYDTGLNLSSLTFSGTAVTGKTANTITSSNTNAWISSYSNENFGLPISFKFKRPTVGNTAMLGLLPAYGTQTPTTYATNSYKFYFTSTTVEVPFGTSYNVSQTASAEDEYSVDISSTGYITMKINGIQKAAFQGVNSSYKVAVSGLTTTVFTDIRLSNPSNPLVTTCTDTDNDGIPNYLDLDSDGDGCPDAKEASITGMLNSGSVKNGSNGAVNSTTTVANSIAAGNYGTNGFADALETSSESGIYAGVYTTENVLSTFLNACSDTDSDGVADLVDIDDDNDGILDAVESPSCFYTAEELALPIAVSTELAPYSTYVIGNSIDGNSTTTSAFAPSVSWVNKEIFKLKALKPIPISGLSLDLSTWALSNVAGNTFKLQGSIDNTTWTDLSSAVSSTATTGTFTLTNSIAPTTKYLYYRAIGVAGTSYYGGVSEIKFVISTSFIGSQYTKPTCTSGTSDGDTTPNHLDLDSDGDGCSDAYEAGTTSSVTANFVHTTAMGANGFADALETSENGRYTGIYTYYYAINAGFKTCLDTDTDGIKDIVDVDDDNDGILDAVESPSCFSTELEASIPVTVTSELEIYNNNIPTRVLDNNVSTFSAFMPSNNWVNKDIFRITPNVVGPIAISGVKLDLVTWALSNGTGNTFKLQGSLDNGATWVDLSASVSSTLTTGSFTISNTLNPTVKYSLFRITGVAGVSYYGGVTELSLVLPLSYQASMYPKGVCTNDTDNDGNLNHQDLDSDGDGCNDAKEAGTATNTTSVQGVVASPYGVNGFADALETLTDNGIYIGNYIYKYAISSSDNGCLDTDNDGIGNLLDLDDDNDGVLDAVEMNCSSALMLKTGVSVSSPITWNYGNSATSLNALVDGVDGTTYVAYMTATFTNQTILQFDLPAARILTNIELGNYPGQTSLVAGGTYKMQGWTGTYWEDIGGTQTVANTTPINATNNSIKFDMAANLTSYSKYRIFGLSATGSQWAQEAYFTQKTCLTDIDNDGISNMLDLDSDGDGCSDALEAGTSMSTTANFAHTSTMGTNGFADALETTAGSGIYNGTYTYTYALNAAFNACTDTDNDGVRDVLDLDDDNDGILDIVEQKDCYTDVAQLTFNGTPVTNITSTTLTAVGTGGWKSSYSNQILSLPISLSFKLGSVADVAMLGLVSVDKTQTLANWNDGGYKFYLSSGTMYGDFTYQTTSAWDFTQSVTTKDVYTLDISETGFVVAKINGVVKKQFQGLISDYRLVVSSNTTYTVPFTEIQLKDPTNNLQKLACTDIDTDSDGIPNRIDTDSDGDGCYDAVEAGTTAVSTSGVASANKLTASSIPSPWGANGFANGLETSAESGVYNATYSYDLAINASLAACTDTDNDGVPNITDIDDDNDGTTDFDEDYPLCSTASSYTWVNWSVIQPKVALGTITSGGQTINVTVRHDAGGLSQTGNISNGANFPVAYGLAVNGATLASQNIGTISVSFSQPVGAPAIAYASLGNSNLGVPVTTSIPFKTEWAGMNTVYNSPNQFTGSDGYNIVTLKGNVSNFTLQHSVFENYYNIIFGLKDITKCSGTKLDTDRDGIPNSQDLDADGDGCSDAKEAGATALTTQNYAFSGAVGSNGLANSLESATDNGTYNYTSTYTYAIDATANLCTDSDFDGIADFFDLDDDNDGMLDATECSAALMIENNSANLGQVSRKSWTLTGYDEAAVNTYAGTSFGNVRAEATQTLYGAIKLPPTAATTINEPITSLDIPSLNLGTIVYREVYVKIPATTAFSTASQINFRIANSAIWSTGMLYMSHSGAVITTPIQGGGGSNSLLLSTNSTDMKLVSQAKSGSVQAYQGGSFVVSAANAGKWVRIGIAMHDGINNEQSTVQYTLGSSTTWLPVDVANGFQFAATDFSNTLDTANLVCDTDGDGIPNQLDLDSDGDGCSDANEAYNSSTAQGTDGNSYYGTGTPPTVDASGKVTTASYTASSANVLTVGRATVITTQPADVTTIPGATNISYSATLTAGSGTTSYQWQVSTNGGGTWTNITNNATYSGATTATLTISTATIAMKEYRYRLNIAQSDYICGNLTSSAARLIMSNTPTVTDDVATATEDTPLNGSVLTNDSGSGGSAITVTNFTINGTTYTAGQTASIPNVGTIILRANGTYTFTPAANYNGAVPVISYTATDANGGSDTGDLTISITPVNDPVVVVNETVSTNQGTAATGSVLTNDTDADGNTLSVLQFTVSGVTYNVGTSVSIPGKGTITVAANGTYTFTPIATYAGAVPVIGYTVSDGNGSSVDGTLTITVIDVNDPPVAADDIKSTLQNTPVSGNVLTNDSDPESNTLSITKITIAGVDYPAGTTATIANVGTVVVNANGTYTFTPTSTFTGAAPVITYTVSDGTATSTAALKVAVTAVVNANPVAAADTKTTTEDTPATGNVLTNDTDAEGNTLSLTSFSINGLTYPAGTTATLAGVGTVVVNANGTYTFTPLANYAGTVPVIGYAISDGNGGTASGTLTLSITPVNDAPLATDDVATATEDNPVSGNVLTNDSDVEGNTLSVTQFVINGTTYPAGQTATLAGVGTFVMNANGTFTFTPLANYSGAVPTVTYTVSDGNGASDTGDLTLNITAVNDAPVASDDVATTPQGTVKTGDIVTGADTDLDGNTLTLTQFKINGVTYTAGSTANIPGVGTLQINADGTYTFTPLPAYVGTVPTVEYTIADGNGGTDTGNFVMTVTDVNDPPAAARDEQTVNQNNPATGNLLTNDTDADGNTLTITQFVINGVTTTVDPTTGGTYVLSGVGTFVVSANGNYTFTPLSSYVGTTPALTYTVSDGTVTATSSLTVYVQPLDTPPVAVADAKTIAEDGLATGNVLSNDTDAESDPLSVTQFTVGGVSYPAGTTATIPNVGTLVVNADGTYTFTPLANYNGSVPAISYLVTDSAGYTATGQLTITVTAVNDAPVAVNDQATTLEDTVLSGNVKTNDSDVDGNTTTVTQFTVGGQTYTAGQTANISGVGSLQMNADGSFTFTPAANYNGAFSAVTYTISDGNGGTATANLAINITAVNDAPLASNDTATTPQGTAKSGDILTGADTDVDGNSLTLTQFTIGGVTYPAGTTASIAGVGTLVINADGTYTFTPISTYVGTVPTVTYTLSDGNGGTSNGTFIVTVTDVPEPPVATDDIKSAGKNTVVTGNLVSNDSDPESNTLTIASYSIAGVTGPFTLGSSITIPSVGTMRVNSDGSYVFTPLAVYSGSVPALTYTVSDGNGGTDTGVLSITVIDTNTPPSATNDPVSATEDTPRSGNVLSNDSDPNGDAISLVSFVVGSTTYPAGSTATIPNVGTITIAANGAFTFTPFANYNGTVPAINYTITDGLGGVTSAALNITVTAVNDAPIAVNDDNVSGPEDSPITGNVLANDSDPDGTPISVSQFTIAGVVGTFTAGQTATIPGKGSLVINANGTFTFTPLANYFGSVPTITYTAIDGSGATANATLNMSVTPVNDPPTVVNDAILVPEGTTGTGNVLTNDADLESGTLAVTQFTINGTIYTPGSIVSLPNVGTFVLNADGTYSFTGVPNYSGAVPVISYTATDGTGGLSTGTLTVTIQNVNDAPIVVSETIATPEDTPASGNVLTNDTDPEATALTITQFLVGGVSYTAGQTASIPGVGTITISSSGAYVFTPVANYFGNVPPVIYSVSDGQLVTTGSITISVTSVNDAPVAVNDTKVGEVNANLSGNVLTNDTDVENGTLSVLNFVINGTTYPADQTATIPNVGTVTINTDGTYTFVPALNYAGTLPVISYNISDGAGGTASANLALSVTFDTDGDGIPDSVEKGPGVAPDTDGDGIPDYKDLDSDNDGILDSVENAACVPAVMPCDIDGDGIPNYLDFDSDGDGISDVVEAGGTDGNADGKVDGAVNAQGIPIAANGGLTPPNTDGTGGTNPYDTDSDGDGISDLIEGTRDTDGDGTPDYKDLDSDNDGISDAIEGSADTDGDGIPNFRDLDSDGDGITDAIEGIADTDNDGRPNFLDIDSDGDGIPDSVEGSADTDNDGTPDYKDLDSDGDGIPDSIEGTTDTDGDGIPNYKDTDSDGDGIPDSAEKGSNPLSPRDTDGDGIPDYKDLDSDGDGIPDSVEGISDTDGDGLPNYLDPDSDGDGIPDSIEKGINPLAPLDTDGDGIPDYLDTDSDNDGISDVVEKGPNPAQPLDTDGDGIPDYRDLDSDNDGISDQIEGTTDTDGDGIPNYRDLDSDADGKPDQQEGVVDTDGDTIPNYLDPDSDGDGVLDSVDQCPLVAGNLASGCPLDSDNDGVPDSTDFDDDNDGILDTVENAACAPASPNCDTDGDGIPNNLDPDSDNDGITDVRESNGTDVDGDGIVDGAVDANGVPSSANGGVTPPNTDGTGGSNPYDTDSDGDGIPDSIEKGPNGNAPLDSDGDGTPNYLDTDSDGDGIPDSIERGTGSAIADTDGDGTPDYLDLDSDGDGITDAVEKGPNGSTPLDTDGDGIPNFRDVDSDGDGIPDSIEGMTDTDGDGIPNYLDTDSDGDGISDSIEKGPNPLNPIDTDGDGTPDYKDLDSDGDGIPDATEGVVDTDGDGVPNYRDLDSDGDGISDAIEGTVDTDGDGIPNYKDLDSDGDGISDATEGTIDTDGDGTPNYKDLDSDGDGISDAIEGTRDTDGDGTPDYLDLDSDGDGISDATEGALDTDGDGIPNYRDVDSDGDGISDAIEGTIDTDSDGRPNYLDPDSDGDGISDAMEGNVDTDGDGTPDYLDLDSDGDGVSDATDACRVSAGDVSNNGCPTDFDGDGIIDSLDYDDDNDGILDTIENAACNPSSVNCDTDGDGIPNRFDLDSDGDGIKDVREANGIDVNADGIVDGGVDANGVPNAANGGSTPPNTDGTGGLNPYDTDSDGDGIPDSAEKGTNGNIPRDTDGDGTPDYLDLDSDNDGILDAVEGNVDTDGDGIPNYRDLDSDGDGVIDATEVVDGTSPTNACSLITAHQTLAAPGWSASDCDGDGNPNSTDPHMNAPTAQNDNFVISGTGQQAFNILANDDFLAGGGITINRLAGSAGGTATGTVSFNANTGMLMYTPAVGEISGTKTVVYQVCKGIVCATATANLNFCDASVPSLDCDGDGVSNGQETTDGTDPLNACSLVRSSQTLTPSSVWTSGDCDGDGNPNSTDPHIATAVANNDLVQVAGSGAQTYNILANDDFLPGNSTIARLSGNAGGTALGTVSFNNATGEMTYTPAVGETSGTKTVVYQVCKNSVCATATVTLSFCNPNDPAADCDGDGVTNGQEAIDGTNPNDACSLNFRSQTLTPSSAWLTADCDGDGVTNGVERTDRTDPTDACSLLISSQVLANASSAWLAADCDGDGNPNGTDDAPLDFCIDGSGQVPANGTAAYDIFRYQDCDNDGILNGIECTLGVTCPDFDGDGIPNYLDTDSDNDQIADISEGDIDSDGDGHADYIDLDSDNDGILDKIEGNQDADGDSIPNYLDLDSDGDGILDTVEATADYRAFADSNGDGRVDSTTDRNYNGIPDQLEPAYGGRPLEIPDTDKDGIPDFLDLDSDGDGIADSLEGRGDSDGDQHPNYRDGDSDGDGISDAFEKAGDVDGDGIPNFLDLDSDGDGIPDQYEGLGLCSNCGFVDNNVDGYDDRAQQDARYPAIDTDKDGIPDFLDLDTDGDGISDAVEGIIDTDGDGIPNFRDTDSDNDGIPDAIEGTVDTDGDGIPNYLDLDSDNDGIPDSVELTVDTDGDGIPNYLDLDSDNDGIPDAVEAGKDPKNPVDTDGDGKPDYVDLDSDNDGILDAIEAGKDPKNPVDTDKDGIPDFRDTDSDNDGIPDAIEAGKDPKNPLDTDKDGIPDYQDFDSDNDGISDAVEAGKDPLNPADTDGDGLPDYRDLDSDNDGIPDAIEGTRDSDGDGIADFRDLDSDNDGIFDALEAGKDPKHPIDSDGDGTPDYRDVDSDNDGIPDSVEGKRDSDGDGLPDYLDVDSDNDGYSDKHEAGANPANPVDTDKDGIPDYRDLDSDADGITDALEDDLNYGAMPDCDHDGIENRIDPDQCETFAPQGISPNGDGQNDVLIIPGIMRKGNNTLTIYNRWGNIVYQKDNYQNDWGGQTDRAFSLTSDENLLPDGTYYYVIDFKGKYPEIGQYVYINRLEK